jgi:ribosomal protein L10
LADGERYSDLSDSEMAEQLRKRLEEMKALLSMIRNHLKSAAGSD